MKWSTSGPQGTDLAKVNNLELCCFCTFDWLGENFVIFNFKIARWASGLPARSRLHQKFRVRKILTGLCENNNFSALSPDGDVLKDWRPDTHMQNFT